MKFFELKMRVIAPLVLMCCLIGAGSQVAQAQSRSLWLGNDTGGDVFQTTTTGSVITDLTNLPTTGIAWDGTNLYFANPSGFFTKRTADGMTVLDSFTITPSTGGGEDLAWDSNRKVLWRILHNPAALQKIDPVSKTLIASYAIPNSDPGFLGTLGGLGIAYDSTRDELDVSFCSAGCSSLAAGLVDRVDPNTGNVLGQLFRTSGFATGGLAYDLGTDTLWVGDSSVVRNMDRSGNVISSFSRPSPGGFVDGLELQTQTMYTNDTNIADFTSDISMYATFSNFSNGDGCATSPFTPTSAELAGPNACRVYTGTLSAGLPAGNNWILATFPSAVSKIVVFPNIDHFGSPYDGYQYQIYGSNNYGSEFPTWTLLFDATSVNACVSNCVVNGTGEPFTLGTFTGTPPSSVNNVLTPGAGPGGTVGYIAQFQFGTAYRYYAFGASTVAFAQSNPDQELSAVGATSSFTTPPQTLTEGQTNNVTFTDGNKINQNVVIQSAILGNTKSMAVKFTEVAQALFDSTRLAATSTNTWSGGTPVPFGTTCTPIPSANNNCVVMEQLCFSDTAGTTRIQCDIAAGGAPKILLASTYSGTSLPPNPGYFTASDGLNDWADITTDPICCTVSGGTNRINTDYFIGDKPPIITITAPASGATYVQNQTVAASYTCTDPTPKPPNPLPPAPSCGGTVPNTSNIDTASVGSKTFTVSSTDAVGTSGTASANYNVVSYNAFVQQPINADTSSVFSAKRGVVPVKFTLTLNSFATCALPAATIALTRTAGGTLGTIDESTYLLASDNGPNFRIDGCQYVYNLASSSLGLGIYEVDVLINGVVVGKGVFALK